MFQLRGGRGGGGGEEGGGGVEGVGERGEVPAQASKSLTLRYDYGYGEGEGYDGCGDEVESLGRNWLRHMKLHGRLSVGGRNGGLTHLKGCPHPEAYLGEDEGVDTTSTGEDQEREADHD